MSIGSAKQFIVDFYANPLIRIKISKIQNKKISLVDKLNEILKFAKAKNYNFSLFDLIKAAKFKNKVQKLNLNDLANIFGGACLNYDIFYKANSKIKPLEEMLPLNFN